MQASLTSHGTLWNLSITLFLFGFCISIYAQEIDTLRVITEEGWIEKMDNKIALDIAFDNAFTSFKVEAEGSNPIVLYPNTPNNLRLTVNYDFISFGFKISPDFLPGNGDEKEKGKTKSFQLGTALIFRHWFSEISYSKVKGYYLENTFDIMPGREDPNFIQFPDLNYWDISIAAGYIHNPKFSLRSLSSQTERQLKSVGSFMPMLNVDYYVVNDKSGGETTQKSNNVEFNIGPGYAYTFVLKERFYASLGLFASAGYLNTKLTTRTQEGDFITNQDNVVFRWNGTTGIGYNSSKFFTGIYANLAGSNFRQENTTAINNETRVNFRIFFGVRLDAPKFLVKGVNQLKGAI